MKRRLLLFISAILVALAGCSNEGWNSGDRVLVNKFVYEIGLDKPERFDVVVFKFPDRPIEKGVPKNYIKRLLGLPGEILAIFFGQLFRMPAPVDGPPYFDDLGEGNVKEPDLRTMTHHNAPKALDWFEAGKFQIIRKPPDVMLAMRRIVYDNDYPASDLKGPNWERWFAPEKESSWSADGSRGFRHTGAARKDDKKEPIDWLRYRHILRPPDNEPVVGGGAKEQLITDYMGYNTNNDRASGFNWVGDLMLECEVKVAKAEGTFCLELSKGIHRFQASWDLASGNCTLYKIARGGKKEELDTKPTKLKSPGTYQVRFANFDARLTVWVDKDLPFDQGRDYPPPEVRGPDEKGLDNDALEARRGPTENDLEPASVGSQGAMVEVRHLRLWRDTYYTKSAQHGNDIHVGDLSKVEAWDVLKKMQPTTMYVQPGHYLCLGDNSPQSSDSRDWGLVPDRLLLGRALLVYFPFNRAGPIR